ncbi:MAG: aminopeptidase P family protein [Yaniella sp.]|uniref:aminopeptidase P family protein n=1 Tax=Yaniella sp. TaxID=2773929 RepID=UPI002647C003|nr:aminopeptidase P family protein [Yaniella sp.]MDN5732282.1 aminopeptidase P family protein [Yaniella sp.]MDN5814516.1 aminopeptidase P family protein [Yaniella sp.]MDN5816857.1 aminopeptidase P family protein [Yaniella sp.]MDN5837087.1 aminopeptidase P family protein [Yaniella sp.]MDN5888326.1 aminopeptidase P family protein [Yaniella sp.]
MTSSTKPQMTDHQTVPHVFTQYNGEQLDLTFSNAEFERRLTRVRELLSTHNLDAFVLTSMHNIKYFSDFVPSPFGRTFAVVITPEGSTTVTPWVDGGMPWRTTYGDNIVYSDWEKKNFFRAIDRVLEQQSIKPSRLGIEFDGLKVEEYRSFQGWFENVELVDMAEPIMRQRLLKSDEEVYLIRQGARIADIGGRAIKNAIREGITEYELAFIGTEAIVPEIAKVYPSKELRETFCLVQSDINTDGAHNWPTTRQLQKGDLLSVNCFPMMSGHYTAMERTMTLGQPDQATLDLWKINVEAYQLGLELIKPGAIAQDIAAKINRFFEKQDLLKYAPIGYGHSFGVMSPYYGREAAMEFREDIETELQPGMVISMEPMLTIPNNMPGAGAYREHDILSITEDGVENFTEFEVGPEHNIIG